MLATHAFQDLTLPQVYPSNIRTITCKLYHPLATDAPDNQPASHENRTNSTKSLKRPSPSDQTTPTSCPHKCCRESHNATPPTAPLSNAFSSLPVNRSGYEAVHTGSATYEHPEYNLLLSEGYHLIEWDGE